MKPALVATDLDGTFLGAGGRAHRGNLRAARDLAAAGVELVIATGRPRRWLEQLAPLEDVDPIVVASNGASIGRLRTLEPDRLHPIDPSLVEEFAKGLPRHLEVSFAVEFALEWGREPDYPTPHLSHDGVVAHLGELLDRGPVIKLLAHTRRANTESLAEVALEAAGEGMTCTFSWSDRYGTVELSAPGVSKGSALAEIIADLGLDPAECVAFGDMPNDLEMLRLVGRPFIMAGSHPSMFDHGFTVIGHHHDGAVGQTLRRLMT